MQRFKVYEDVENVAPDKNPRRKHIERQALGEIKNTILTRSKYLELKKGIQKIKIKDQVKQKPKRSIITKKAPNKKVESNNEINKSPQITRRRRLSSLFRVSEYANDIYKYLQRIEDKYPINSSAWMEIKLGENTRFALVDWLVEINEHFQFIHETFQLCISIIDRYIQEDKCLDKKKDLQLIALAAVFIASKYEEIIPLEINDLLYVCDSSSSTEEILKMEMKIATEMQYSFGRPVPAQFIRRYCNVARATRVEQSCAFYLTDVALMSHKLCYLKPSIIAASAMYIALCVSNGAVDQNLWNMTLINYSTYDIEDFKDCTKTLARCLKNTKSSRYQAIEKKYSKQEYFNVSQIPELETVLEELAQ
ncbi:G2/mitotic-specific cyclin-B2 [Halyomorpha halys]|uniref:G2/mitotic-specific cyclin-B2 n=1 Tax=Halyomorpha halys TaxID=286706 RepID=UPI0006D50DC2|nr:G2/mitotic-specific cyclin-B2-like [Halyomorpha halys]